MKVNYCLAIVLGLWMIVSAASDALADCGYKLWLWPEGGYYKNYCDLGLCYMRCKWPNSRGASRACFHPPNNRFLGIPLSAPGW